MDFQGRDAEEGPGVVLGLKDRQRLATVQAEALCGNRTKTTEGDEGGGWRGRDGVGQTRGVPNNRDISREKWTNTTGTHSGLDSERRHALRPSSSIAATLDYIRLALGRSCVRVCSECISTRVKSLRGSRIYLCCVAKISATAGPCNGKRATNECGGLITAANTSEPEQIINEMNESRSSRCCATAKTSSSIRH